MDEESGSGFQLTLEGDDVWVRWLGLDSNVKLGPKDAVGEEMSRFLANVDYGESVE